MKICIYSPTLSIINGGTEKIIGNQIEYFYNNGVDLSVITIKSKKKSIIYKELLNKVPNYIFNEITLSDFDINEKIIGNRDLIYKLSIRTAQEFDIDIFKRYDLVVTHLAIDSLFIPDGVKNILHLHGTPSKKDQVMSSAIKRPNGFISVSSNVKDWRKKEFNIDSLLIHNGIDVDIFKSTHNKEKYIDVLFVGRFVECKGIKLILDCKNQNRNIVFIGDGPLREDIEKHKFIKIYTNISTNKLVNMYNSAKVFVCPSTEKEGVLTTMLEAGSCGTAIITSNGCGMIDFAKNNHNALLVETGNSVELDKKIEILLNNDRLRSILGNNASNDVNKKRSIEKKLAEVLSYYKNILGAKF